MTSKVAKVRQSKIPWLKWLSNVLTTSGTRSARRGPRVYWLYTSGQCCTGLLSGQFRLESCGVLRLWVGVFGGPAPPHFFDFFFYFFFAYPLYKNMPLGDAGGLAVLSSFLATPRHQIQSPKRGPKKSAQGRLPQSDLPQPINVEHTN
jgi:hypothetical protein